MFDGSVRILLVVRMPGVVPAGKKCDALLNHVDLFPTIAGLVGAAGDLPKDLTGKDRSQVLLPVTTQIGPAHVVEKNEHDVGFRGTIGLRIPAESENGCKENTGDRRGGGVRW